MKKTIEREIKKVRDCFGEPVTFIPIDLVKETAHLSPKMGEIDMTNDNRETGLKVEWDTHGVKCVQEFVDGEWRAISGIQKLSIEFDVAEALPKVTMIRYVV